jgi:hypothetical protein
MQSFHIKIVIVAVIWHFHSKNQKNRHLSINGNQSSWVLFSDIETKRSLFLREQLRIKVCF